MAQDLEILRRLIHDQQREIDAGRAFIEKVYTHRATLIKKAGSTGRALALEAEELLYGTSKGRRERKQAYKQASLWTEEEF